MSRDSSSLETVTEEDSATGTMEGVEDDDKVRITHYINPHCFWYKPETAYIPHHKQRQFLEEFNEYCERAFDSGGEDPRRYWGRRIVPPKVGDLVAQYNTALHRWIRCQVEAISVDLSHAVCYQLWAIDEGVPIKSVQELLLPLPKAYTSLPGHAKRGSLRNILPGDTRYDYAQGKNVNKIRTKWYSGVVSALQIFLDEALSLGIVEHAKFLVNHEVVHFVDIFMWTHGGRSFNVVDLLRDACSDLLIVSPDEQFFKAVFNGKTLNMVRYKNNDGIDNTSTISNSSVKAPTATQEVELDTPNVQSIVGDWFRRNMKAVVEARKVTVEKERMLMLPLINAATLATERKKNLPLAQNVATQGEKKTHGSGEAPNDPHPSSSVQREVRPAEEDKKDTIVPHTSEVLVEVEKISTSFSNILKLHQRREQLGISKKHPASTTKPPLIGPAGCSIKMLSNNTNKPYA